VLKMGGTSTVVMTFAKASVMGEYTLTQSFTGGKNSTNYQLSKNNIAHNNICRLIFQDGIIYG